MPFMGPIRGDMSMAPMITAVELTLSPTDAMMMANIRIQRLVPLKTISFSMVLWMVSKSSISASKLK